MSKWHDFLLEHAKFPLPHLDKGRSVGTADISGIEVGLLERVWKAFYLTMEEAFQSGKLPNRIPPRCYGAFEGNGYSHP